MASKMSEFGYVMCETMCVLRSTAVRLRNFDVVFAPLCSLFVPYSYIMPKIESVLSGPLLMQGSEIATSKVICTVDKDYHTGAFFRIF